MNRLFQAVSRQLQTEVCTAFMASAGARGMAAGQGVRHQLWSTHSPRLRKSIHNEAEKNLTEALQSPKGKLVFDKVLSGQHVPPPPPSGEAAARAAASASTSTGTFILGKITNALFYTSLAAGAVFLGSYSMYTDEELEQAVEAMRSIDTPVAAAQLMFMERLAWARDLYSRKKSELTDPPTDHLLPDLHPFQVQHNLRTLVLDLDEVLVHSDWTRQVGWKTFKRPGASDFLEVMAMYYEVVVFTNELNNYADPLLHRIDPGLVSNQGPVISYRLYKNSCQYEDGEYRRDLSKLNRDLSKVIFVTTKKRASTCMQPENMIIIKDWPEMDPNDTTLLDLVPMLQMIVMKDIPDVRTVCKSYEGKDVVSTFRERMASAAVTTPAPRPATRGFFSMR